MNISSPSGLCIEIYFYEEEISVDMKFLGFHFVTMKLDEYRDLTTISVGEIEFNDTLRFYCIY